MRIKVGDIVTVRGHREGVFALVVLDLSPTHGYDIDYFCDSGIRSILGATGWATEEMMTLFCPKEQRCKECGHRLVCTLKGYDILFNKVRKEIEE